MGFPVCGAFELLLRLGGGGMADVFLARPKGGTDHDELFALKLAHPSLMKDPALAQTFIDESRIGRTLDHPNIAKVYGYGEENGRHFIVMEYVPGRNMRELARRSRDNGRLLPVRCVAWVLAQIGSAIDYAHDRTDRNGHPLNIVHRDLGPHNVMIGHDGVPKLIDFGIAHAAGRTGETVAGRVKGKSAYMAPEQARGLMVDARADIFAMGILLYEQLTGELPFRGATDEEIILAVVEGKFTPPRKIKPDLPDALVAIIERAMQLNPRKRYATAHDLTDELDTYVRASGPTVGVGEMAEVMAYFFAAEQQKLEDKIARIFAPR